jgi:hypothetical protein
VTVTSNDRRIIQRANELGYFPLVAHVDAIKRRAIKIHLDKWGHVYDLPDRRRKHAAELRRQANADIPAADDAAIREVMEGVAVATRRAGAR